MPIRMLVNETVGYQVWHLPVAFAVSCLLTCPLGSGRFSLFEHAGWSSMLIYAGLSLLALIGFWVLWTVLGFAIFLRQRLHGKLEAVFIKSIIGRGATKIMSKAFSESWSQGVQTLITHEPAEPRAHLYLVLHSLSGAGTEGSFYGAVVGGFMCVSLDNTLVVNLINILVPCVFAMCFAVFAMSTYDIIVPMRFPRAQEADVLHVASDIEYLRRRAQYDM